MGLTLSSGGLSGTPTIAGTSSFTLIATDTNGCTGSLLYAFIINPPACPTILLAPSPLPTGTVGVAYSQLISATGGTAPYTFALASGSLPVGLLLSSNGVLSGMPTIQGTSGFTVIATDSHGCTGSLLYALVINPPACPTILLAPSPLPTGTVGVAYSQLISATGGTAPYTFALASGSLPVGLLLSSNGVLSGMPTIQGTSGFTVIATDSHGCTGEPALRARHQPAGLSDDPARAVASADRHGGRPLQPAHLGDRWHGSLYLRTRLGSLPVGLLLSSNGVLSGMPTIQGTSGFTVIATDTNGCTGEPALRARHQPAGLSDDPARAFASAERHGGRPLQPAHLGDRWHGALYLRTRLGSSPVGLLLSSNGVSLRDADDPGNLRLYRDCDRQPRVHGEPALRARHQPAGLSDDPARAVASADRHGGRPLQPAHLGDRWHGALYLSHSPRGACLWASRCLRADSSRTPTIAGTSSFTLIATDTNGCTGSLLSRSSSTRPRVRRSCSRLRLCRTARRASPSQVISATGGTAPYSFALASGSLPVGLTLSSGGLLSGTPTIAGTSSFT